MSMRSKCFYYNYTYNYYAIIKNLVIPSANPWNKIEIATGKRNKETPCNLHLHK